MSGRGLGHTGGTLDKLESIPGFRVELAPDGVHRPGARGRASRSSARAPTLVPADKLLYALRDVTATVDQLSLIAASIMSKKLAGGAQAIVLDVKVGDGAFMKTLDDARALAETMLALGEQAGREVVCLLTDMEQPLGRGGRQRARGARGARDACAARARRTSRELVVDACARAARPLRPRHRRAPRRARRVERAVADGSAAGGLDALDHRPGRDADERALERGARSSCELAAPRRGHGRRAWARSASALAALHLGAGRDAQGRRDRPRRRRRLPAQARRPRRARASRSPRSTPATRQSAARALAEVAAAYELGDEPVAPRPILLEIVS